MLRVSISIIKIKKIHSIANGCYSSIDSEELSCSLTQAKIVEFPETPVISR